MDRTILAKGNQSLPKISSRSTKKAPRTRQANPRAEKVNPILEDLTSAFNPIFEEMLEWMEQIKVLSLELKMLPAKDKRRSQLESRLEWYLTKVSVRAKAVVEQMYELMPEDKV